MAKEKRLLTSESVTEGHPDKLCDQISDGVLDEVLRQDPKGRVACETFVSMGLVIVGGEITTEGYVDVHKLVRKIIQEIGYTNPHFGFDFNTPQRSRRPLRCVPYLTNGNFPILT